jgi:membrane protease YdiL (CAAX protease family)
LLAAAIVGGVAKAGLDVVVTRCPAIAEHVDYDAGGQTYEFGKPFRYLAMGIALISLIAFGGRLQLVSLARMGLQRREGWGWQLFAGLAIGLISLFIAVGITALWGVRTVKPELRFATLAGPLLVAALQAGLTGLVEEVFFRGFVLQSFLKDMRALVAVLVTSFGFSALHFLDVKVILPVGADPLAGFRALAVFKGMFAQPIEMLPKLIGLALVGIALSYAYVWTRSLYLPIGLHSGWVFALKASRLFFQRDYLAPEWLFGGGIIVTGVLGIVLLLGVLLILYVVWGRGRAKRTNGQIPNSKSETSTKRTNG